MTWARRADALLLCRPSLLEGGVVGRRTEAVSGRKLRAGRPGARLAVT
jgi:hypothetical protein